MMFAYQTVIEAWVLVVMPATALIVGFYWGLYLGRRSR